MKNNFLLLLLMLCTLSLQAQFKKPSAITPNNSGVPHSLENLKIEIEPASVPPASQVLRAWQSNFRTLPALVKPASQQLNLEPSYDKDFRNPIALKGLLADSPEAGPSHLDLRLRRAYGYLEAAKPYLGINDPVEDFELIDQQEGRTGDWHLHFQQYHQGIAIHGAQISLHLRGDQVYLMTGRSYPNPANDQITSTIDAQTAKNIAWEAIGRETNVIYIKEKLLPFVGGKTEIIKRVWFPTTNGMELAWDVEVVPNLAHRHQYFIGAETGTILRDYGLLCGIHGHNHDHGHTHTSLPPDPSTTTDTDLNGQSRLINTYESQGTFLLLDVSRPMFNAAQSDLPQSPVGAIVTLDALNKSPQNDNFEPIFAASSNNNFTQNEVSAHYNAGVAYEYFRTTYNRNSIDGVGGTIISVINVTDENENDFDNAFWNGFAMFYGNGNTAFTSPLARSLDVAGHEMSHGVIQGTANLEYFGESGAMNEAYADIFGTMIDRDDWQLGEDVVNTNVFSTGALRDMQNPNNGGSGLGSPGWQPKNVSEQFFGSEDNGGVHINSGIINRAYYLFATEVGKDVAEQVYYNALDNYLVRSSKFIDLRIAIIASANELYNSSVANEAATAFDIVEIFDGEGGDFDQDLDENPGEEHILFTDADRAALRIIDPQGNLEANPLITEGIASKPSITDDGSLVVYVTTNKTIRIIQIDWANGSASADFLSENPDWRNVAISKDGQRLAAISDDFDNRIYIFDLSSGGNGLIYTLFNPTTAEGVSTGDVNYADFLEWDASGEFLMYDALSTISNSGTEIDFWDIGFMRAWNNSTNDFGDGFITKLFNALPDNTSVGNPSFAKNSPEIITMDFFDANTDEYSVLAVNSQTGDVATLWDNVTLGYPNYSVDDSKVIFDAETTGGDAILAVVALDDDHITPLGNATIFYGDNVFTGASWGTWFADGDRDLTSDLVDIIPAETGIKAFPNPFREQVQIQLETAQAGMVYTRLTDIWGRTVAQKEYNIPGTDAPFTIDLAGLPGGSYFLQVEQAGKIWTQRLVKM